MKSWAYQRQIVVPQRGPGQPRNLRLTNQTGKSWSYAVFGDRPCATHAPKTVRRQNSTTQNHRPRSRVPGKSDTLMTATDNFAAIRSGGARIQPRDDVVRRPNFAFTVGYPNASWTLRTDLVAERPLLPAPPRAGFRRSDGDPPDSLEPADRRRGAIDRFWAPRTSAGGGICSRGRPLALPYPSRAFSENALLAFPAARCRCRLWGRDGEKKDRKLDVENAMSAPYKMMRCRRPGHPGLRRPIVKYVILIHSNPAPWAHPTLLHTDEGRALSPATQADFEQKFDTLMAEISASGEFVTAEALAAPSACTLYRWGPDGPLATDGPFAESKEQLAGLFLIDCQTRERAEEIAERFAAPGDVIELRPAMQAGNQG